MACMSVTKAAAHDLARLVAWKDVVVHAQALPTSMLLELVTLISSMQSR